MITKEVPVEEVDPTDLEPRAWTEEQETTAHQAAATTESRVELLILSAEQKLDATTHTTKADIQTEHRLIGMRSVLSSLSDEFASIENREIMSGQGLAKAMLDIVLADWEDLVEEKQDFLSKKKSYSNEQANKQEMIIAGKKQALDVAARPLAEAIGLNVENPMPKSELVVVSILDSVKTEVEQEDYFLNSEEGAHKDRVRQKVESLLSQFRIASLQNADVPVAVRDRRLLSRLKAELGSDLQDARKEILRSEKRLRNNWLSSDEERDLNLHISVFRSEVRVLNFIYDQLKTPV